VLPSLPPAGTGKTSTIVHAIRALVSSGASVLVAAYTNSALDNILLKLADSGVHQFLRLGRAASCHARIRGYMPGGER
jgi:DNA replication ATP-dependent helicase Dna2